MRGYPGYQRLLLRAAGIFDTSSAIGRNHERRIRAGHYKDLTETGNRARKVSGNLAGNEGHETKE